MDKASLMPSACFYQQAILQEWACVPQAVSPAFAKKQAYPTLDPPVFPVRCLVLHGALSQTEEKLLKAMSAVLSPHQALPRMRLYPGTSHEVLKASLHFWGVSAIWLLGEKVAQFFLKTGEPMETLLSKSLLFVDVSKGQPIPVLISEHPRDIIDNVRSKKRIYQDLLQFKARIV